MKSWSGENPFSPHMQVRDEILGWRKPFFSTQLRDEIWEWPWNEANYVVETAVDQSTVVELASLIVLPAPMQDELFSYTS